MHMQSCVDIALMKLEKMSSFLGFPPIQQCRFQKGLEISPPFSLLVVDFVGYDWKTTKKRA